jgi:hypothetical protein
MKTLVIALLILFSSSVMAAQVRVSEDNGGDGNFVVRGFVETYDETSSSAASLYSYGNPCPVSYNGTVFAAEVDQTVLAVIDTSEGRTVFVVHDISAGGGSCAASGDITNGASDNDYDLAFDPDGMECMVRDDNPGNDSFSGCGPGSYSVSADHQWDNSRTDGIVLGTFEGAWQLDMSYNEDVSAIDEVVAKGSDGNNVSGMTPGNTIRLDNVIEVIIDIKFCSDPNAFNCKKRGVLPVTIFGTGLFDGWDIDVSSLRLCRADGGGCTGAPVDSSVADRGAPGDAGAAQCELVDTDDDGILDTELDTLSPDGVPDLDAAFDAGEVQAMLGDFCNGSKGGVSSPLVITGTTVGGIPFISVPLPNAGVDQLVKANK